MSRAKRATIAVDERNPAGSGDAMYAPTCWAGYARRTGYFGRDFAHQAAGAHARARTAEIEGVRYTVVEVAVPRGRSVSVEVSQ